MSSAISQAVNTSGNSEGLSRNFQNAVRFELGLKLARQRRYDAAAEIFSSFKDLRLDDIRAEREVCITFIMVGNFDKASEIASDLLKRMDTVGRLTAYEKALMYNVVADARSGQKRYAEAVVNYKLAAKLSPELFYESLYRAGDILVKTGRPKEAIEVLEKALTTKIQSNGIKFKAIGLAYLQLRLYQDAISAFQISIKNLAESRKVNPDYGTFALTEDYRGLVTAYKKLHRTADAEIAQHKLNELSSDWGNDLLEKLPSR